ncbi:PHB depolymerase family esterase [Duganella sp. LX47W]|uniref:PHB depolymerase family esterase n=2 Tax=Rugamonas apoptosis TaxID=2758570 RepID=A0A7W2F699_9BURK|nr:PHB depolymerase family esterase [Rugamonas apoptosis]
MRAATNKLLNKGPAAATAAIQQALNGLRGTPRATTPTTPAMRDINSPPARTEDASDAHGHGTDVAVEDAVCVDARADHDVHNAADAPGARGAPRAPSAADARQAAARTAPQPPPDASFHPAGAAPDPATHPIEYAQDLLNRMGIAVDIQAGINGALPSGLKNFELPKFDVANLNLPPLDLSGLDLPGYDAPRAAPAPLPPGAQFITGSYANHAGERKYKLYIPSSYNGQPMPLLVMLHGCTQNPDDFAAGTRMNEVAEERQFLVAYPEQTRQANNGKCWNWFNAIDQQRGQGEPSLIAGIAEQVKRDYRVLDGQVYVAGLSAGGAMAVIVGTLYPDVFAAVGVHSGLPYASAQDLPSALSAMKRGTGANKASGGSLPIIVFHGDRDTTVHPRNGEAVMAQRLNGNAAASVPSVQSGSVPNGHRYTQTTHRGDDGKPVVEHWVVHGAGHAWSGGSAQGSYTDGKGPDASREMMRFFSTVS